MPITLTLRLSLLAGLLLTLAASSPVRAQDPSAALIFAHPARQNPALGGMAEGKLKFTGSHINRAGASFQGPTNSVLFSDINENYNTSYLSVDWPFLTKALEGGVGLYATTDRVPGMRATEVLANFSYEAPLGTKVRYHHLRAGVQAGIVHRSLVAPELYFEDQFNGIDGFDRPSDDQMAAMEGLTTFAPDVSIGLTWYRTQKIKGNPEFNPYASVAWHHITRPRLGFFDEDGEKLNTRISALAGTKFRTRTPFDINVYAQYELQNNSSVISAGVMGRYVVYENGVWFGRESVELMLGSLFRLNQSVSIYGGLELKNLIRIGLAYEFAYQTYSLTTGNFGGFQATVGYTLGGRDHDLPALPFPEF